MRTRDTLSYCYRDLVAKRAMLTSIVMVFTVMILAALSIGSFGLAFGARKREREQLKDRWSTCLRVGIYPQTELDEITLNRLREEIQACLRDANDLEGISPFRTCTDTLSLWRVPDSESGGESRSIRLNGRTVNVSSVSSVDLFIEGRLDRAGVPVFSTKDTEGIYLSPSALQPLGLPADLVDPPDLHVYVGHEAKAIHVIGILRENLPEFYDYVIPESLEARLLVPEQAAHYVNSGLLPREWYSDDQARLWSDPAELPAELASAFEGLDLPRLRTRGDGKRLRLGIPDDMVDNYRRPLSWFHQRLEMVRRFMTDRTGIDAPDFARNLEVDGSPPTPPPTRPYHMAHVFVKNLDELEHTADACDRIVVVNGEGTVLRDIVNRLRSINERYRAYLWVVAVFEGAIVALSAVTLSVMLVFRAFEKTPEAGMLRAMGTSRWHVMLVTIVEVSVVSLLGVALGFALGLIGGNLASSVEFSTQSGQVVQLGFYAPPLLFVVVGCGCLAISLSIAVIATFHWLVRSPASLLASK